MPNYKSRSDEFSDLEARLRQNRPQNDPMSPAFKRRLRAHLLEQERMNKPKLNLGRLAAAVAGLVLIVGIPLFFWSIQNSLSGGAAEQPSAAAIEPTVTVEETAVPEPALPTPISTIVPEADEENVSEAETAVATVEPFSEAAITAIGVPEPITDDPSGAPPGAFFTVPVTVSYTLQGYEEAVLVVAYELTEANGSGSGRQIVPIVLDEAGSVTVDLTLSNSYVDSTGAVRAEVSFTARINSYDEDSAQYVNIFPGDVTLSPTEQDAPYPYPATDDFLALDGVTLTTVSEEELALTLTFLANVDSQPEGMLTAVITHDGETLASSDIAVSPENSVVTLPLTLAGVPADTELTVAATLTVGEEERVASVAFTPAELSAPAANSVWIVDADVEPGANNELAFTFVVGYQLEAPYTGGMINHRSSFVVQDGSGGGGGGGGGGGDGRTLPAGTGLTTIRFSFSHEGLTIDNWEELLSVEVTLLGITDAGGEELVDVVTLSSAEE